VGQMSSDIPEDRGSTNNSPGASRQKAISLGPFLKPPFFTRGQILVSVTIERSNLLIAVPREVKKAIVSCAAEFCCPLLFAPIDPREEPSPRRGCVAPLPLFAPTEEKPFSMLLLRCPLRFTPTEVSEYGSPLIRSYVAASLLFAPIKVRETVICALASLSALICSHIIIIIIIIYH